MARNNALQRAGAAAIRARKKKPKVSFAPDAYAIPGATKTVDMQGNSYYSRPGKTTVKFTGPASVPTKPASKPKIDNPLAGKGALPPGTRFSSDGPGDMKVKPPKRRRKRPMYGGSKKPLVVYED